MLSVITVTVCNGRCDIIYLFIYLLISVKGELKDGNKMVSLIFAHSLMLQLW